MPKRNGAGPGREHPGMLAPHCRNTVGDLRELVRHDRFLGQAQHQHQQAVRGFLGGGPAPGVQVGEKFAGADNRAGHQLRKKRNKERVIDGIGDRGLFPAVDVDHIGHALERMETDAQRQDDAQREGIGRTMQKQRNVLRKEVIVFEKSQQPEVGREADDQRGLAMRLAWFRVRSSARLRNRSRSG